MLQQQVGFGFISLFLRWEDGLKLCCFFSSCRIFGGTSSGSSSYLFISLSWWYFHYLFIRHWQISLKNLVSSVRHCMYVSHRVFHNSCSGFLSGWRGFMPRSFPCIGHCETNALFLLFFHLKVESFGFVFFQISLTVPEFFAKRSAMLASCEEYTSLSRAVSQLAETEENIDLPYPNQSNTDHFLLAELLQDYVWLLGTVKVQFSPNCLSLSLVTYFAVCFCRMLSKAEWKFQLRPLWPKNGKRRSSGVGRTPR